VYKLTGKSPRDLERKWYGRNMERYTWIWGIVSGK
jgi:hypothetical protein